LLFGARRSERVEDNLEILARFFVSFACLSFDDRCAEGYGLMQATLTRLGTPIGPNDLLITSMARAYDLTLVSHNVREFSRVPGLRVEDWEASTTLGGPLLSRVGAADAPESETRRSSSTASPLARPRTPR